MQILVPQQIADLLAQRDASGLPLIDYEIAGAIDEARRFLAAQSPEEQSGGLAELAAFQFAPAGGAQLSIWNTYFAPRGGATFTDGSSLHVPDIAQADTDILEFWKRRAGEVKHPVLRARYSDLVWDFAPYFKARRDPAMARAAIDAYLDIVSNRVFKRGPEAVTYLGRAQNLALSIRDTDRTTRAVTAMLSFFKTDAQPNHYGTWSFVYDDLLANKNVSVTPGQEAEIITGLEEILRKTSTLNTADFSPFDAQEAAERLASYYHRNARSEEVRRVVRTYGGAFEAMAAEANASLATAWLAPVLDAYRNLGMDEDAKRVQLKLADKAKTLQSEMKSIAVPIEITQAEAVEYIEMLTAATADECLARIAFAFLPKAQPVRDLMKRMASETPLLARIAVQKAEEGFTVASAGSVEDDPDGRLLLQLAQYVEATTPMLSLALERAITRHTLGLAVLSTHLYLSPVYRTDRRDLLEAGLGAHLAGDYVKSIHVLVPQIEEACRTLLGFLGEPMTRVKGQNKGLLHQKNLNEILDEPAIRTALREDARLYLKAFLVEPIGLNVRNRLSHGLMNSLEFTSLLSDRVVHVLLILAQLRITPKSPASESHGGSGDRASEDL